MWVLSLYKCYTHPPFCTHKIINNINTVMYCLPAPTEIDTQYNYTIIAKIQQFNIFDYLTTIISVTSVVYQQREFYILLKQCSSHALCQKQRKRRSIIVVFQINDGPELSQGLSFFKSRIEETMAYDCPLFLN